MNNCARKSGAGMCVSGAISIYQIRWGNRSNIIHTPVLDKECIGNKGLFFFFSDFEVKMAAFKPTGIQSAAAMCKCSVTEKRNYTDGPSFRWVHFVGRCSISSSYSIFSSELDASPFYNTARQCTITISCQKFRPLGEFSMPLVVNCHACNLVLIKISCNFMSQTEGNL